MEHPFSYKKYVAYFRVSTQRQGASGLGLSAQRTSVSAYIHNKGEIVAEFTDIESGKKNNRPELLKAIALCKEKGAVLLIAKLDRLTRNVAFIFTLRDSGAEFVCADMPQANTLTIGVMATMAQHEREVIGDRTRKALAEKKRAGYVLGKPENLTVQAVQKGLAVRQLNAREDENNRRAAAFARSLRGAGVSWSSIAATLNEHVFRTRRGKQFQAVQVQRIMALFN
ncbi:recombinase family protein [Spirosoma spitsbergense]|uniref:recombinase family protein n=1 Tax=Spirosoma spitsbergense TaxID=431554 RepID=UPI00036291E7|nr:recombinase family protein [Spirosoma spitsbergense]